MSETFAEYCSNNSCDDCELKSVGINEGCSYCEKVFMQKHDAKIRAEAFDEIIKIVKDHNNTRTVSTKNEFNGKHQYYRAISQSKMIRLLEKLKEENNG